MRQPLRIAIAGLGTVGCEVIRQLEEQAALIAAQAGRPIEVKAVSSRNRGKNRSLDLSRYVWVDGPLQLATLADIDAVVEVIGGADGIALQLAKAVLGQGRHFVTANKALLAQYGGELTRLAEQHQAQVHFEAAVAGGIPIIKTLCEGLAGNPVKSVYGILNGTCNYILTQMQDYGLDFTTALQAAQQAGYAEADPATDIEGHDTAHKLAILSALAFRHSPQSAQIEVSGINPLLPIDLKFARELGYAIKLLGVAQQMPQGLQQFVAPCLVPLSLPLATINDVLNAVMVETMAGPLALSGRGAGGAPTAGAVISDLIDIARGHSQPAFATERAAPLPLVPEADFSRWYLRVLVADQPGVVADLGAILRDEAISIESLLQHGRSAVSSVPVVMVTHSASAAAMRRAVNKIANLQMVQHKPCCLRLITGESSS